MERGEYRRLLEIGERITHALEKQTAAIEEMAKPIEPVELEVQRIGAPVCPNCGKFDPEITTEDESGTGRLSELFILGTCGNCKAPIYCLPESYSMHKDRATLITELENRRQHIETNGGGKVNG
jgi:hypothetical protein